LYIDIIMLHSHLHYQNRRLDGNYFIQEIFNILISVLEKK
jgi:hypothetical protein